jgi:hypothetical protein
MQQSDLPAAEWTGGMHVPREDLFERRKLWVTASHKLAGWAGDAALVRDIQDLGWVEFRLLQIEERLPGIVQRQQQGQPEIAAEDLLLNEAMAMSRLWLFGLYESMRTYRQAVRGNGRAWQSFANLDRTLNTVRAPLAKHQIAGQTAYHTAGMIVQPVTGRVGWAVVAPQINASQEVLRIDLADELLEVTSAMVGAGEAEAMERNSQTPRS